MDAVENISGNTVDAWWVLRARDAYCYDFEVIIIILGDNVILILFAGKIAPSTRPVPLPNPSNSI